MNHKEHKKIGQWLAYMWTYLTHKNGTIPLHHKASNEYLGLNTPLAYNLPIGESVALSMSAEIEPVFALMNGLETGEPAEMSHEDIVTPHLKTWFALQQELGYVTEDYGDYDLLRRPNIYN